MLKLHARMEYYNGKRNDAGRSLGNCQLHGASTEVLSNMSASPYE